MIMLLCEEENFKGEEYLFKKWSSLIWLKLPLVSCVTLDMSHHLSEFHFPEVWIKSVPAT